MASTMHVSVFRTNIFAAGFWLLLFAEIREKINFYLFQPISVLYQ